MERTLSSDLFFDHSQSTGSSALPLCRCACSLLFCNGSAALLAAASLLAWTPVCSQTPVSAKHRVKLN